MKILKLLLALLIVVVLAFSVLLLVASITNYQPEPITKLPIDGSQHERIDSTEIKVMLWNLGYAGLNADMDFFYDGGEQVMPSKEQVIKNFSAINKSIVAASDSIDFFMLQEVDQDSKRSYHMNQYELLRNVLPDYESYFGKNYDVGFVPIPLKKPMGKVTSGIATFSRYHANSSERYSFEGNYDWPLHLFMLDRCFLLSRYAVNDSTDLVMINTHNSAFDNGELRDRQLGLLKLVLEDEYKKGNYVVAGGDWNMTPFGFVPEYTQPFDTVNLTYIPSDYFNDWTWVYPTNAPTNRRVKEAYEHGRTQVTTIDFFLLSPNISAIDIKAIDVGFCYTDHQSVYLRLKLN